MQHLTTRHVFLVTVLMALPSVPFVAHADTVSISATTTVRVSENVLPIVLTRAGAEAALTSHPSMNTAATATVATSSAHAALRMHAAKLTASDAKVTSVILSSRKVSLWYREPARLFGFIPLTVPVQISVDTNGTATVLYPWYGFLLSADQAALVVRAQAAARQELGGERSSANSSLSTEAQARLLDSLHALLVEEASGAARASTSLSYQ
jgi:hypothetical protein